MSAALAKPPQPPGARLSRCGLSTPYWCERHWVDLSSQTLQTNVVVQVSSHLLTHCPGSCTREYRHDANATSHNHYFARVRVQEPRASGQASTHPSIPTAWLRHARHVPETSPYSAFVKLCGSGNGRWAVAASSPRASWQLTKPPTVAVRLHLPPSGPPFGRCSRSRFTPVAKNRARGFARPGWLAILVVTHATVRVSCSGAPVMLDLQ